MHNGRCHKVVERLKMIKVDDVLNFSQDTLFDLSVVLGQNAVDIFHDKIFGADSGNNL